MKLKLTIRARAGDRAGFFIGAPSSWGGQRAGAGRLEGSVQARRLRPPSRRIAISAFAQRVRCAIAMLLKVVSHHKGAVQRRLSCFSPVL